MIPVEERLATLEAKVEGQDAWLKSIDGKLDDVIASLNMGKGAWYLLLKIGVVLAAIAGFGAWLFDHVQASWK